MIEKLSDILIVSDIDGTLLYEKDGISAENREAIRNFTEKGGRFTVATGRAIDITRSLLNGLSVNVPSIHINGGYLYDWDKDEVYCPHYISVKAKEYCRRIIEKFPFCDCHFAGNTGINIVTKGNLLKKYLFHSDYCYFEGGFDKIPDNIYKYIISCDPENMDYVRSFAEEICEDDVQLLNSSPYYLEVLPLENSKENALKQLCQMTNIPLDQVIAVGDYENDIGMLRMAGIGAAVENAQDSVKKVADLILPSCRESALYHLIAFLEEIYG